ncbi:MAG: methanogen output domain 1-containing protein [Candidatus Helarchaeota archaeon]
MVDDIKKYKFISSIFKMSIEEMNNIMGPETIKTVYRLIGERVGESIVDRMKNRFNIETWTPENFSDAIVKDVLTPVLGEGGAEVKAENGNIRVKLNVCPFEAADMDITHLFYCTYTEGLIQTSASKAFEKDVELEAISLKAEGKPSCEFLLKL